MAFASNVYDTLRSNQFGKHEQTPFPSFLHGESQDEFNI